MYEKFGIGLDAKADLTEYYMRLKLAAFFEKKKRVQIEWRGHHLQQALGGSPERARCRNWCAEL